MKSSAERNARRLARAAESLHSCSYYAPEIHQMKRFGYSGWWHSYFAYRSAPLGAASAREVVDLFYNFAPRMVEQAVPGCWEILDPEATRSTHLGIVEAALLRIFKDFEFEKDLEGLVALLKEGVEQLDRTDRPLFSAWASEPWPSTPLLALWHAATLMREFRFDGHNQCLREFDISGLGCHLLMVADGRGTPQVIQKIRGWSPEEWEIEISVLRDQGWLNTDGSYTDDGRQQRKLIEALTDQRASTLGTMLDPESARHTMELLERVSEFLITSEVVPGHWPPKHLNRNDHSPGSAAR